jgi:hypothetical protein
LPKHSSAIASIGKKGRGSYIDRSVLQVLLPGAPVRARGRAQVMVTGSGSENAPVPPARAHIRHDRAMSEWGIVLIAAGSAVAGSVVTGWFTRSAGHRQAAAAQHAGDRQADALLATVQATLDDQRHARVLETRRQVYVQFLQAAAAPRRTEQERTATAFQLDAATFLIRLEGPDAVAKAANRYARTLDRIYAGPERPDDWEALLVASYDAFIEAARRALEVAP